MYICLECKAVFGEPDFVKDPVGTFMGSTVYEDWAVCPECGETDIEEAVKCGCGEHTAESEPLCKECKEIIIGFVGALKPDEMDYLQELIEELE